MSKTITFPISDELHSEFRKYCWSKQLSMKDALTLAIQLILKPKHKK